MNTRQANALTETIVKEETARDTWSRAWAARNRHVTQQEYDAIQAKLINLKNNQKKLKKKGAELFQTLPFHDAVSTGYVRGDHDAYQATPYYGYSLPLSVFNAEQQATAAKKYPAGHPLSGTLPVQPPPAASQTARLPRSRFAYYVNHTSGLRAFNRLHGDNIRKGATHTYQQEHITPVVLPRPQPPAAATTPAYLLPPPIDALPVPFAVNPGCRSQRRDVPFDAAKQPYPVKVNEAFPLFPLHAVALTGPFNPASEQHAFNPTQPHAYALTQGPLYPMQISVALPSSSSSASSSSNGWDISALQSATGLPTQPVLQPHPPTAPAPTAQNYYS